MDIKFFDSMKYKYEDLFNVYHRLLYRFQIACVQINKP